MSTESRNFTLDFSNDSIEEISHQNVLDKISKLDEELPTGEKVNVYTDNITVQLSPTKDIKIGDNAFKFDGSTSIGVQNCKLSGFGDIFYQKCAISKEGTIVLTFYTPSNTSWEIKYSIDNGENFIDIPFFKDINCDFYQLVYNNDIFVCYREKNLYYSIDGINWNQYSFNLDINDICFGKDKNNNNIFIVDTSNPYETDTSDVLYYTTDFITWNICNVNLDEKIKRFGGNHFAYGNHHFILFTIGYKYDEETQQYNNLNFCLYSDDGINWKQGKDIDYVGYCVVNNVTYRSLYSYDKFICCYYEDDENDIYGLAYSIDGNEWIKSNITDIVNMWQYSIVATDNEECYFVGIKNTGTGNKNFLLKTTDGINWIEITGNIDVDNIIYGNGKFLTFYNNDYYYSNDCQNWIKINVPVETEEISETLHYIIYSNNYYVFFRNNIYFTNDLIEFKQSGLYHIWNYNSESDYNVYKCFLYDNKFNISCCTCSGNYNSVISNDGINWEKNLLEIGGRLLSTGASVFCICDGKIEYDPTLQKQNCHCISLDYPENTVRIYLDDGTSISDYGLEFSNYICYAYSKFIATKSDGIFYIYYDQDNSPYYFYSSYDIQNFSGKKIIYVEQLNIVVCVGEGGIYYTNDGVTFTKCNDNSFNDIIYDDNNNIFVVTSTDNNGIFYSKDGINWQKSNITQGNYNSICYDENNSCFLAPLQNGGIYYSVDGIQWQKSNITTGNWKWIVYLKNKTIGFKDHNIYNLTEEFLHTNICNIINSHKITQIGSYAFCNTTLTSFVDVSGCNTFNDYCFCNVKNINTIYLNEDGATIQQHCFEKCTNLHEIINLNKITQIGSYAFYNCDINTPIWIDKCNSIGSYAFANNYNLKEVILKSTLGTIPSYCFYNCENLRTVKRLNFINTIGDYAFYNCKLLENGDVFDLTKCLDGSYSQLTCSDDNVFVTCSSENKGIWRSEDGINWKQSNKKDGNWNCITYGSKALHHTKKQYYESEIYKPKFICGSNDNLGLFYSENGNDWTSSDITDGNWNFVKCLGTLNTFGDSYYEYFLCGSDDSLKWSYDGVKWSDNCDYLIPNEYNFNLIIQQIINNESIFVATLNNSGLYYSNDLKNWTQSNITSGRWNSLDYVNGKFIATSNSNSGIFYSENGKTWSQFYTSTGSWNCMAYDGDKTYMSIQSNKIFYLNENNVWTQCTGVKVGEVEFSDINFNCLTYGNGKFIAGSISYGIWYYYYDDETKQSKWIRTNQTTDIWKSLIYCDNKFIAASSNYKGIITSTNGLDWSNTVVKTASWDKLFYKYGVYLALCTSGDTGNNLPTGIYVSYDSINWYLTSIHDRSTWSFCYYTDPELKGSNNFYIAINSSQGIFKSTDYGVNWQGIFKIENTKYYDCYINDGMIILATNNGLYYSVNGVCWHNTNITTGSFKAITYSSDKFIATSYDNNGIYYSSDGITWQKSSQTTGTWNCVQKASLGQTIAGSNDNYGLKFTEDGINWSNSVITTGYYKDIYYNNCYYLMIKDDGLYYSYGNKKTFIDNCSNFGNYCFSNSGLQFITIKKNLDKLSIGCFSDCPQLYCIMNLYSVNQILSKAFYNCKKLRCSENDKGNTIDLCYATLIDTQSFVNCIMQKITFYNYSFDNTTPITQQTTVQLNENCFENCSSLNEIDGSHLISQASAYCFNNCSVLAGKRIYYGKQYCMVLTGLTEIISDFAFTNTAIVRAVIDSDMYNESAFDEDTEIIQV